MIKRLFVLLVLIGGGILMSNNVDLEGAWKKAQLFLENEFGVELFKDIEIKELLSQKEKLEKKLSTLTKSLEAKVEEGTAKFEEIETSVMETKQAIEDTQKAIENLQESTEKTKDSLGF
jgi:peptidoglycan hydrolase CwlO-like protein